MDLSSVDTDHLARQAIKLFSKRYGHLYDSHIKVSDTTNKGYMTYAEMYARMVKSLPGDSLELKEDIIQKTWLVFTGGNSPTEVPQLDRQKLIELCIKGFHSKDQTGVQLLIDAVTMINRFLFDSMDTNHDGEISKEEFVAARAKSGGNVDKWQEGYHAVDLNGDGHIDRDEWLQCNLGFFFHIDEERYNHFFGEITD